MKATTIKRHETWRKFWLGVTILAGLLAVLPLHAGGTKKDPPADPSKLTLQRIFASGDFASQGIGSVRWLSKQGGYAVTEASEKNKAGQDIVRYDPATGKKEVLVGAWNLIPPGGTTPLGIASFTFAPNEGLVLIYTNTKRVWRHNDLGDYWVYDITSRKLHKLGGDAKPQALQFAKFSPDSKKVAYVKDKNVFVEDLATEKIIQLTERKTNDIINGTFDWVYEEELDLRDGIRWSPDSKLIAFWQLDTSGVKDYHLINNTDELYPKITTFKYPKVGETNSACKVGIVSLLGKQRTIWPSIPGDPRSHYVARMDWMPASENEKSVTLLVQQLNRLQNTNKVITKTLSSATLEDKNVDPSNIIAETKVSFTETDKAWVDVHDSLEWFDGGKQFTWISERDGWRHVYAISRDGKQQKVITPGKFDVMDVLHLDEEDGWLYYYASPDNPTRKYLYRSKLDGSKTEKVTPDEFKGSNSYDISPDSKWAIHTHSNFSTPPVTRLIQLPDHKVVRVLKENKKLHETIKKIKHRPGEFFRVDIGDGVDLDGWCIKPPDFDPAKKYPVLFHVYGEPAGQTVLDRWGGQNYLWHQMLAQQGYVVMSVDNRGTPAPRGREFRKIIYKQLGSIAPQDQAKAVRAIEKQWPWVDPQRIGIWGWSGGGSMTLHAMFRFPDVYQTGMAIAAVTNERFYDSIYSERYMGLPGDNVKGYKECSPITYAGQLKGNLLIVHGTGDDNVHYANAEALFNELIAQNKQFTMMAYPNRSHSISEGKGTRLHLFTLLTNYLHKNLPAGPANEAKQPNGKAAGVSPIAHGAGEKTKLKELQEQRLKAATKAFELIIQQPLQSGPSTNKGDASARVHLMLKASKLMLDARLDLCETKEERIQTYSDMIGKLEPLVEIAKKQFKAGTADSFYIFPLAKAYLLDIKVAMEKQKQER
jgi:dipeptidyl-peptidase-4